MTATTIEDASRCLIFSRAMIVSKLRHADDESVPFHLDIGMARKVVRRATYRSVNDCRRAPYDVIVTLPRKHRPVWHDVPLEATRPVRAGKADSGLVASRIAKRAVDRHVSVRGIEVDDEQSVSLAS